MRRRADWDSGAMCPPTRDWDSGAMCADAQIGIREQCAPTRRLGFGSNVRRRADWDSGAMGADALIGKQCARATQIGNVRVRSDHSARTRTRGLVGNVSY
ncbi:unnamed protein product, partial [Mesorhabditis spiculigera]